MMYDDELENIERDYNLMLEYMKRGFNDPQRKDIYNSLLTRLYRFVSNLRISYMSQNIPFYTEATRKSINQSFSNERIKSTLESFVTDTAMLSLEPESVRAEKARTFTENITNSYSRCSDISLCPDNGQTTNATSLKASCFHRPQTSLTLNS